MNQDDARKLLVEFRQQLAEWPFAIPGRGIERRP